MKRHDSLIALDAKGTVTRKETVKHSAIYWGKGWKPSTNHVVQKKMKSISYELLINKDRQISDGLVEQELGERSAIPSTAIAWHSYVQRFLKKRSIVSRKTHGESGDADSASVQHFRNCWRHEGLQAVEGPELAEPQHVFPELDNNVAQLNELDDNLPVACPPSDDTATIVQMLAEEEETPEEDDEGEALPPPPPPSYAEVFKAL
eukprot:scpid105340/ scgid20572/ 